MTRDSDLIGLVEGYLDEFEGHTPLPDAARDVIRARLPSTTQRPAWWPGWRFPEMNTMMKFGLAAAAVAVAAVLGFNYALAPDLGVLPAASQEAPSPRPLPDQFSPLTETIKNGLVRTHVRLDLPSDGRLEVIPGDFDWVLRLADEAASGSWGIWIADATGASNHVSRFSTVPIAGGDASEFLAGLDATASYVVSGVRPASVDGRDAVAATIRLESPSAEDAAEYHHLDVEGQGSLSFAVPNVTYLVDVDGQILMIQVWGRTESELAVNRLVADAVLASIQFNR